jgi:rare lipoprotein A (peptidoglycan hydrolase)
MISTHRIAGALLAATILACSGCKRPGTQPDRELTKEKAAESPRAVSPKPESKEKLVEHEVQAVWYDVPDKSLAKRRAGQDELTAAHNRLPLGTLVRVTHLANGKSVVVRITDRGVSGRHGTIDLCKEAAEKLDILREGSARVRLEVLPDGTDATATVDSAAAATP